MSGKKQKAAPSDAPKAVEPSRMEFPNLTARDLDAPEVQAVTMLDYEGSPVVTYGIGETAKRSRGAS